MDFCKKTFNNMFLLGLLTLWTSGLFHLNPSTAAADVTITPDNSDAVTVNALVMAVNQMDYLMIVGEKTILITKFIPGNPFKTDLLDKNGSEVKLSAFNIGERVLVKGFKLPDGAIKAESIKKMPRHPSDTAS